MRARRTIRAVWAGIALGLWLVGPGGAQPSPKPPEAGGSPPPAAAPAPAPAAEPAEPAAPRPRLIIVPGQDPAPEAREASDPTGAGAPEADIAEPVDENAPALTQAGPQTASSAVVVEPGVDAADISEAVAPFAPPRDNARPGAMSYRVDFVNRLPSPQTRILVLDTGAFGGAAGVFFTAPQLIAALTSDPGALVQVTARGVRSQVRLEIPAGQTLTIAFRFSGPAPGLTVEMWEEAALSRNVTAALLARGVLLGLALAGGAVMAGFAAQARGGPSLRAAWAFGAAFLALAAAFALPGAYALGGLITHGGAAHAFFALAAAAGLSLVRLLMGGGTRPAAVRVLLDNAPGVATAAGLLALFNAPFGAFIAKAGIGLALASVIVVIAAGLMRGEAMAKRLSAAALLTALALAPLMLTQIVAGSLGGLMLGAAMLLLSALTVCGFVLVLELRAGAPLTQRGPVIVQERPATPVQAASESRAMLALAAAHHGIFDWDLNRDALFLSPSLEPWLGGRAGALSAPGRDWAQTIHPEDLTTFLGALAEYRQMGDVAFAIDFRARGHDARYRWLHLRGSFISDGARAVRCLGIVSDVSAAKEQEAENQTGARADAATGLANRAAFLEAVRQRMAFGVAGARHALLVLNLDRFRTVNEALGHAAGDALLAETGLRLSGLRPADGFAARIGGDHFALVWQATDQQQGIEGALAILSGLAAPVRLGTQTVYPAASGGLTLIEARRGEPGMALSEAELALAHAKRSGGGQLALYAPQMRAGAPERLQLEADLRLALTRNEIELYYQPIVHVLTGQIAGFEALMRWRHPQRGLLLPESFLSVAQTTGVLAPLSRFALESAAREVLRWRAAAPGQNLFVTVNATFRQIMRADFQKQCETVLAQLSGAPGALKIEITETDVAENPKAAERALQRLQQAGAGLAIDDFGVGQSTLHRLAQLPFDTIKIDKSFLSAPPDDTLMRAVVTHVVRLARDMGLTSVAEGVEDEATMRWLSEAGCDMAQGYYTGAPCTADEALALAKGGGVRRSAAR